MGYGVLDLIEVIENLNSQALIEALAKANGMSFEKFMEILESLKELSQDEAFKYMLSGYEVTLNK